MTLQELQQLLGNRWDTDWLRSHLADLQAAGIEVQNQDRGDLRPRFRFPNGDVWDFGPGGWVSRGQMGPGFTPLDGSPPGDEQPPGEGDQPPGQVDPGSGGGGGGLNTVGVQQGAGANFGGFFNPDGTPRMNPTDMLRSIPGYQFAYDQGLQAVERSAFARGTGLTGGTLKALQRFGTGLADQTYENRVRDYLSLADLGARTVTSPIY